MTPAMVLECRRFESELPKLSHNSKAYILGHKAALEMIRCGDDSFEVDLLSRLIKQHAFALAYREYVAECIDESKIPQEYDEWLKWTGQYEAHRKIG